MSEHTPDPATAADGGPGTLTVAGRLFVVGQPTPADFVLLRKHVRRRSPVASAPPRTALAQAIEDTAGLPADLRKSILEAAVKNGGATPPQAAPLDPEAEKLAIVEALGEPDVCAFWLWALARKHEPGLALDAVTPLVTAANVDGVFADLLIASGMADADPNAPGPTGSCG